MSEKEIGPAVPDKELSGIERELVLQYLKDDNIPLTVTLEEKPDAQEAELNSNKTSYDEAPDPIPPSAMFPVAIPTKQMEVLDKGIILLKNAERSVQPFLGKTVRVQFYFNHVGLYFLTTMKECSAGLALVVPGKIFRIPDVVYKPSYSFKGYLSFSTDDKDGAFIQCVPKNGYNLFIQPNWADVRLEKQKEAKALLEQIVNDSRNGVLAGIGNGLQLFPVCRYLTEDESLSNTAIEGRAEPVYIIYVDEKRLVLSTKDEKIPFVENEEYGMVLEFTLEKSILKRNVKLQITLGNVYKANNSKGKCYEFLYSDIKQEDLRFLYDRIAGRTKSEIEL